MTGYVPKVGDRVRVVIEGTVQETHGGGLYVSGHVNRGVALVSCPGFRAAVSVEVLPDPEPEWRPGDVVVDADGETYQRDLFADGWYLFATSEFQPHGRPVRPLTLVVRFGKAVK